MAKCLRGIALITILLIPILPTFISFSNINSHSQPILNSKEIPFIPPQFEEASIIEWKELILSNDLNLNGINDQFEDKLDSISSINPLEDNNPTASSIFSKEEIIEEFFGKMNKQSERLTSERLPVIIHFPMGDYEPISDLFDLLGGNIKSKYKEALNGFSGIINCDGLTQFCESLNKNNVPFLVEEDCFVNANLYYSSRNMNLRPYVWNTLGYTGDTQGSIAIIDSGIDDSHNFFNPGFSNGNFDYKIVGWRDEVSGLSAPYDDNSHGSHCAGIAAGEGTPVLDGLGRTVSTFSYGFDLTGYMVPDQTIDITAGRFNVTEPGIIEVQCEFTDYTPGSDNVYVWIYLYREESIIDSYVTTISSWIDTLTYTATISSLGDYSFRIRLDFDDNTGDGYVYDPHIRFRGEIHWPFNPQLFSSGDPWKGIAPDTHLVGIKVLDSEGGGYTSDIIDGINWAISNRFVYHITTISMSLGGASGQTSMISAVNNAVNNGIVTVISAGNDGAPGNNVGSPGDADNVITVAAMSSADQVTDYSSSGGSSYTGLTIKPDLMAPGGSYYNFSVFSTDTNDNDASGEFPSDGFLNDLTPALGTSMATPAVAGAANLVIDSMGGYLNWNYTDIEAKKVKSLLLMSATETYPLQREIDTSYSPTLNRGGKDIHEGYGRLNVDVALEAVTQELVSSSTKSAWLTSSLINPFVKHGLGCHVNLIGGEEYEFRLDVPLNADFDLYLYSGTPSSIGEPILISSNVSSGLGVDEFFNYTPSVSGRYYLIAKAISGEGMAEISLGSNDFAPTLINGQVIPSTADQSTLLNFSVVYQDWDNNKPISINVLVNGSIYPMGKCNISDNNYMDGCIFQSLVYLQPGSYNYQFECSDGKFSNITELLTGLTVAEVNIAIPFLLDPKVTPEIGGNFTKFNFTVDYYDADNNFPANITITISGSTYSMNIADLLDHNVMDGKLYYFTTSLDYGFHQFQINCSDGLFSNSTTYINGPEVNPFYAKEEIVLNEIHSGEPDFIELYNYGSERVMTNYFIELHCELSNTVAILNGDSADKPSYWTGGFANNYLPLYNGLTTAGINTIVITNNDIISGVLSGVSVVILIDNCPNDAASSILRDWAFAGGSVISFDSSICFLNWAGLLPPEASGTNGYNVYWDYSSPSSGVVIDSSHPIMAGYSYGQTISGTSGDARYYSDAIASTTAGPYYTPLVKDTIGSVYDLIAALDPPYAGRVVHSWDMRHWETTTNQQLILNAVNWANIGTGNVSKIVYNFPNGWIFSKNHVVTLHEGTGTDTNTDLYLGNSIPMSKGRIAVGLFNGDGDNEDWFQTFEFNETKPIDAMWVPDTPLIMDNNYAHRISDEDTDKASDWVINSSGTQGILNPGQTGGESGSNRVALLNPNNGSIFFSGLINFSWSKLGITVSPLNYTIEISNETDFSFLWYESNLSETSDPEQITLLIDWPTDNYYWRVIPYHIPFYGNWSEVWEFYLIHNNYYPKLMNYSVLPPVGDQFTYFNFSTLYTDLDNNPPNYINVIINGNQFPMQKQNPSDNNYIDGCLYQYLTTLTPATYTYAFECSDGKFYNSTALYSLDVIESNNFVPQLVNPLVSPQIGHNTTLFEFSVWYFDADNNAPTYVNLTIDGNIYPMFPINPLDINYIDGAQFNCALLLDYGIYQFKIDCYDMEFYNSTGWIDGPEVNPFYGLQVESGEIENVAIFRTNLPWGRDSNEQILLANGINYDVYSDADLGVVSLSSYDKVLIPSVQSQTLYDALGTPAVKSWLESYVSSGGILELHYCYQSSNSISGELPGGSSVIYSATNALSINSSFSDHPIVDGITDTEIDSWSSSAHCYLTNLRAGDKVIIYSDGDNFARLTTRNYGSGLMIYSGMTLEWGYDYGYSNILENIILYSESAGIQPQLLNPVNASIMFSGLIDFTWKSLELPLGTLNYTIQISNSSDFSNILHELTDLAETPITTTISAVLNYSTGQYYWRVIPTFGIFYGNWSDPFILNIIFNAFPPSLISGSIDPPTGDQFTEFNFTVTYIDPDNNPPSYVNVSIDGNSYSMTKLNLSDLNYADGCLYQYSTTLIPANYTYTFECSDGKSSISSSTYSLEVTETNNFMPQLTNWLITPLIGANNTPYYFYIDYFDSDNNDPESINITINDLTFNMFPEDPLDNNYIDGKQYYYVTFLDYGLYEYKIDTFDGVFNATTGWLAGPEVNPFYGLVLGSDEIVLNEVCISPDFVEMYNYGPDKVMTGWTIGIYYYNALYDTYTFPTGWVFRENYVVVLRENSGTNTNNILYTGWNIPWGTNVAVGLFDNTGANVDWFEDSIYNGPRPPDVEWIEDVTLTYNQYYMYRQNDKDTNKASDWLNTGTGSQGSLNPGQTGQGTSVASISLLTPTLGTTLFSGLIDFTWSNLNVPFGPVNYTLQISNTSSFSTILYQFEDIPETPTITSIIQDINQLSGLYYWRVCPTFDVFSGNWSDYSFFNLIQNNFAPYFTNSNITPSGGDQFTQFNFTTTYWDPDDNPPSYLNLIINGSVYPMIKENPLDFTYTDGCKYLYSTGLIPGNYTYTFECSDGKYSNISMFYQLNVIESNNFVPQLINPQVSPLIGVNTTLFNYTVWYYDADNNKPQTINLIINSTNIPMLPADPMDMNVMDGALYYYTTQLDFGYYKFKINCSDGGFTNSTQWFNAPEVNPLYGFSGNPSLERVAIFRDNTFSYSYTIDQILTNNGIILDIYTSSSLGVIDLSVYDKVIIPSVQTQTFYDILTQTSVRIWLESFIASGGTFEFHLAHSSSYRINGVLPGGSSAVYSTTNSLTINASHSTHPIVDGITSTEIDSWGYSAYNYLINLAQEDKVLIYDDSQEARLTVRQYGAGLIIYSGLLAEWGYYQGYSNILENIVLYSRGIGGVDLLSPLNGSTHFTGLIDFAWESIELPYGPSNYTLQISNSSDFSVTLMEITDISEIPSVTSISILINYSSGQYYWRVRPTFEIFSGNWSNTFVLNIIFNEDSPSLISGLASPPTGDQFTEFNFTVTYLDPDDNPPLYVNVLIDGSPYPMTKQNLSDLNYADGCLYQYLTYLTPKNYTFVFECSDGKSTIMSSVFSLQVIESNNFMPELINWMVTPSIGANDTPYYFFIDYFDADNNHPESINITINGLTFNMFPVDPFDNNFIDGKQYYYVMFLDYGLYEYKIDTFDGIFNTTTGWLSGPEVNPFYGFSSTQSNIIINEVCYSPDFIEMYNYGSDQVMTGWTVRIYFNNALNYIYSFPTGWVFRENYVVVLQENSGTDTSTVLYAGYNIPWGTNVAVGLFDDTGANVDWFQVSIFTGSRPGDADWIQDITLNFNGAYIYRINDEDTDYASDWSSSSSGTQGFLNPGQTGTFGGVTIPTPLYPLQGEHIYITQVNFTWKSLNLPFNPLNYSIQISNVPDFSNVLYQLNNITGIPITTSKLIELNFGSGWYYWRICAIYGVFSGNWSNSQSFYLENYQMDPIVDPPFPNWIWIVVVGTSIASLVIGATVIRKYRARNPSQPTSPPSNRVECETSSDTTFRELKKNIEEIKRRPIKKSWTPHKSLNYHPFYCHHCDKRFKLENVDKISQMLCSDCGTLMVRLVECAHCQHLIPVLQEVYNDPRKELIHCFYCDQDFPLVRTKVAPINRPVRKRVDGSYLKLHPETYICPKCKTNFNYQEQNRTIPSYCPFCNLPIKRLVECNVCKYKALIKQEEATKYLEQDIECPSCKQHHDDAEVREIIQIARSPDRIKSLDALELLGKLGNMIAIPTLISIALYDSDPEKRSKATISLGNIGSEIIRPILKQIEHSDLNQKVKDSAIAAQKEINEIREYEHSEELEELQSTVDEKVPEDNWNFKNLVFQLNNHSDPDELISVIEHLGDIGNKKAVPHLIKILALSKDRACRSAAVIALGRINDYLALDAIANAEKSDPDFLVRYNAAITLKKLKFSTEALPEKAPIYLSIDPECFSCPNCKATYSIAKIDIFRQYRCPICNNSLDRILLCSECAQKINFKQEDFFRLLPQKIECPHCMNKNIDLPLVLENYPTGNVSEDELELLFRNILNRNKKILPELAKIMNKFINKKAIPALIGIIMYNCDATIRILATISLGMIAAPEVLPILRHILDNESDETVRKYIIKVIRWTNKKNER